MQHESNKSRLLYVWTICDDVAAVADDDDDRGTADYKVIKKIDPRCHA